VIYGPGRISFAEALPGLLTSLGFLGTLIGLAQGLSGFSMTDADAVQNSIVTLIPGMRYAFMTSIFGVVGSVAFTLITRAVYGSTEHTLTRFYSAMSRHAGVLSVDPMTQIAIYQQEQTALIKTMTKDINGKFTETMSESILKAMEPVNATMQGFVNGISREQARLIDNVLERFLNRMDESMNGSLKRFAKTLDETAELQRENSEAVRASLSGAADIFNDLTEIRRMVQDLLEGVSAYVDQLSAARQEADEAYMRINGTVEQMELVARQQSDYLRKVSSLQADLAKSTAELTAALDKTSAATPRTLPRPPPGCRRPPASSAPPRNLWPAPTPRPPAASARSWIPRWTPIEIMSTSSPSVWITSPPTSPAPSNTCPTPSTTPTTASSTRWTPSPTPWSRPPAPSTRRWGGCTGSSFFEQWEMGNGE